MVSPSPWYQTAVDPLAPVLATVLLCPWPVTRRCLVTHLQISRVKSVARSTSIRPGCQLVASRRPPQPVVR